MPDKRDRPQSLRIDDAAAARRRQLTAERTRQWRDRQRAARAATTQLTPEQLQQGEQIVSLAFTDEDAAETLTQLGLRVQGVTLAQDAGAAHIQQGAVAVNEHDQLYHADTQAINRSQQSPPAEYLNLDQGPSGPLSQSASRCPNQSSLSQFFRTRPAPNPLASTTSNRPIGQQNVRTPSPELPFPFDSHAPVFLGDDNDQPFDAELPTEINDERPPDEQDNGDDEDDEEDNRNDEGDDGDDKEDNEQDGEQDGEQDNDTGEEQDTQNNEVDQEALIHSDQSAASDHDSNTESSAYNFASEHSMHSEEDESSDNEISAHDYTVQKLFNQFQGCHNGCSSEQHEEQLQQHNNAAGDNHHGLDQIFNNPDFPSVLALSELISADRLAQQAVPTPAHWQAMFCGISPQQQYHHHPHPMNVCLHSEQTQAIEPRVAFDIDSFLGFTSSLAMARQGLWYQPAPQMRQNMTTDVHLETNVLRDGNGPEEIPQLSSALLRDVPHFLLGRVMGAHDIAVHVLFPRITPAQDKFMSLTQDQHSRWLDQIFHPAVYRYCKAHYTQHLPASYQHALANSAAHQVEGRKIETASYQAKQALGYHLQPEYLNDVWTDILHTIAHTPGLHDFGDLQLFFSAKGTKLQFKTSPSRPTLLHAMENFQSYFERVIDMDFVFQDRLYVDIGKEICPQISLLPLQQAHVGDEAQVYM